MADATDSRLQESIDRLNAGDLAARDELLQLACRRLERLARKMLNDFPRVRRWADTGDVLQNALLRLLQALASVKISSAQEFFRLAALQIRRELLDLARHYYGPQGIGAKHATGPPDAAGQQASPAPNDPSDSTFDPAKLAVWTEFHRQVEALPDEEREAFDLLWYQELTQADAAYVLKVSEITVRRRWLSARLHLRAALKS
jgi:RNA polymerase sigma factor (sigma-70 family)